MRKFVLVALVAVIQLVATTAAFACPACRYSPYGWGFCRYDFYAGYYDCVEYVTDDWTGRTDCSVCGYCNWSNPNQNVPCSAGNPRDPENPTGRLNESPCASPNMRLASHGLSWVGARVDQVAIF